MASREVQIAIKVLNQASKEVDAIVKSLGNVDRQLEAVERSATQTRNSIKSIAGPLQQLAVAAGGAALVKGLDNMAQAANQAAMNTALYQKQIEKNNISQQESVQYVNQLAKSLGLSTDQVKESSFALLKQGYSLDQMKVIFSGAAASALQAGTSTAEGIQKASDAIMSGLSAPLNYIGIAENLGPMLQKVERATKGMSEETARAYKNQQVAAFFYKATKDELGALDIALKGYAGANNNLAQAIDRVRKGIGQDLIPIFTTLKNTLANIINWYFNLDEATRNIISKTLLAVGAFSALVGGLGALSRILPIVTALFANGLRIITSANPILLAVMAAIAALTLAWKNNWFGIQEITKTAIAAIGKFIGQIPIYFQGVKAVLSTLGTLFGSAFEGIKTIFQGFGLVVKGYWLGPLANMVEGLGKTLKPIMDNLADFLRWVGQMFKPLADLLSKIGVSIGGALASGINALQSAVGGAFSGALQGAANAVKTVGEQTTDGAKGLAMMREGANQVKAAVSTAGPAIASAWNAATASASALAAQAPKVSSAVAGVSSTISNVSVPTLADLDDKTNKATKAKKGLSDAAKAAAKAKRESAEETKRLAEEYARLNKEMAQAKFEAAADVLKNRYANALQVTLSLIERSYGPFKSFEDALDKIGKSGMTGTVPMLEALRERFPRIIQDSSALLEEVNKDFMGVFSSYFQQVNAATQATNDLANAVNNVAFKDSYLAQIAQAGVFKNSNFLMGLKDKSAELGPDAFGVRWQTFLEQVGQNVSSIPSPTQRIELAPQWKDAANKAWDNWLNTLETAPPFSLSATKQLEISLDKNTEALQQWIENTPLGLFSPSPNQMPGESEAERLQRWIETTPLATFSPGANALEGFAQSALDRLAEWIEKAPMGVFSLSPSQIPDIAARIEADRDAANKDWLGNLGGSGSAIPSPTKLLENFQAWIETIQMTNSSIPDPSRLETWNAATQQYWKDQAAALAEFLSGPMSPDLKIDPTILAERFEQWIETAALATSAIPSPSSLEAWGEATKPFWQSINAATAEYINQLTMTDSAIPDPSRLEAWAEAHSGYWEKLEKDLKDFLEKSPMVYTDAGGRPGSPGATQVTTWRNPDDPKAIGLDKVKEEFAKMFSDIEYMLFSPMLQFGQLINQINPIAAIITALLERLNPIIETLMVPMQILADIVAALLLPVFKALFPVVKLVGIVFATAAIIVAEVWNALAAVVKFVTFGLVDLTIPTAELYDSFDRLVNLTWEQAEAYKDLNKQIRAINVPELLNQNRLAYMGGAEIIPGGVGGTLMPPPLLGPGLGSVIKPPVIVNFYGITDTGAIVQELKQTLKWEGFIEGGRVDPAW